MPCSTPVFHSILYSQFSYINSQLTNIRLLLLVVSSKYGGVKLTTGPFCTNDLEAPSQKLEWLALSPAEKTLSTASTIQPSQRTTEQPVKPTPQSQKRKTAEDYAKDRVGKYTQYFEKDRILPIPELVEAVEPKTLSFIISDLRTRKLAGLKKETFEELLKTAGVPCRYFCRQSFTM